MLGGPARAFMAGLMLLAGLILLAACANLGSLFAARAADRAKETALRLALGSRRGLILRQMLTEAVLVSLAGGALGLAGGLVILRLLSAWQPIPDIPINVPVNPDAGTYVVALLLALASGLLFGMVPVRQVMRADPWQVIRTGGAGVAGCGGSRCATFCWRCRLRSVRCWSRRRWWRCAGWCDRMHSNFGFDPQNVMLADAELHMAGYTDEQTAADAAAHAGCSRGNSGRDGCGLCRPSAARSGGGDSYVFTDSTTDYRPTNQAADAMNYHVSPGYMRAAGTRLLAGRDLSMRRRQQGAQGSLGESTVCASKSSDRWTRRSAAISSSMTAARRSGGRGGRREIPHHDRGSAAGDVLLVSAAAVERHLAAGADPSAIRKRFPGRSIRALHGSTPGCRSLEDLEPGDEFSIVCRARGHGGAGRPGAAGCDAGGDGNLRHGLVYREQAAARAGDSHGPGSAARRSAARSAGAGVRAAVRGLGGGIVLGVLATKVLSYIVYQAAPKDPLVLGGVALTMLVLGLMAAWIPAQRALAVNPMILMREE